MTKKIRYRPVSILIVSIAAVIWLCLALPMSHAATIWTGPLIVYSQPTSDPTQVSNQDHLTPDVWLTRAASKGLFNAFYETNATTLSPTNTEWAFGTLNNYASLTYTNWLAWLNGLSPTTLVGKQTVLHLISDDIYLSVEFTNWAAGGAGGFAYQRSTPAPALLSAVATGNQTFGFSYSTSPGYAYVVQGSTNLINWVSLATNIAVSSSFWFSNSPAPGGAGFYRVNRVAGP